MAKRNRLSRAILAEGEVTGHFHEAIGEDVAFYDDDELEAPNGAKVIHQEHKPCAVPADTYERRIVREQDHAADEAREVKD